MWNFFFLSLYPQWRYFLPTLLLTKTRGVTCIVGETLCNILWSRKKVWKCSFKFFKKNDITQIYGFFSSKFWHDSQTDLFLLFKFLKLWSIHIFYICFHSGVYNIFLLSYYQHPIWNFLNPMNTELLKVLQRRMAKNFTTQFTLNCKKSCYSF